MDIKGQRMKTSGVVIWVRGWHTQVNNWAFDFLYFRKSDRLYLSNLQSICLGVHCLYFFLCFYLVFGLKIAVVCFLFPHQLPSLLSPYLRFSLWSISLHIVVSLSSPIILCLFPSMDYVCWVSLSLFSWTYFLIAGSYH